MIQDGCAICFASQPTEMRSFSCIYFPFTTKMHFAHANIWTDSECFENETCFTSQTDFSRYSPTSIFIYSLLRTYIILPPFPSVTSSGSLLEPVGISSLSLLAINRASFSTDIYYMKEATIHSGFIFSKFIKSHDGRLSLEWCCQIVTVENWSGDECLVIHLFCETGFYQRVLRWMKESMIH